MTIKEELKLERHRLMLLKRKKSFYREKEYAFNLEMLESKIQVLEQKMPIESVSLLLSPDEYKFFTMGVHPYFHIKRSVNVQRDLNKKPDFVYVRAPSKKKFKYKYESHEIYDYEIKIYASEIKCNNS